MSAPDVVVIGGGIAGVSTAAHLAEAGVRVALYEREAIAAAASGRNSGVVQRPHDPVLAALYRETLGLYRARAADAATRAVPAGTRFALGDGPAGLLYVGHDARAVRSLAGRLAETLHDAAPRYLAPGEACRLEPALGEDVAACRLAVGYPVAPAAATTAYAAWAERLGVRLAVGAAARPWREGRSVRGVVVDGARIAAGAVVVAAGPWSPDLVDPSGRWRPIRPSWGVVGAVELARPPRHVLEEAEIDIEPGPGAAGEAAAEAVGAPGEQAMAFSLITLGSTSSLGSTFLERRPDPAALVPALVEHGARFVPGLRTARRGAVRACARPLALDGRPLVGALPGVEDLWIAAGHGPWGISTGPATGFLLAELVLGRRAAPPTALDPARFGALG